MFKLVILCAFFAVTAAEPGAVIAAPFTQYSTFLTPGTTTIARQDSSVIHPSPLFYQAPLAYTHFIKKRSPQFPLTYSAPAYYSGYPNYYAATTYNSPLINSGSILPASIASVPAVHLIKKRSAVLPATTYYAPSTYAATTPLLASTYSATGPYYSHTPLISQPLYSHFIKKRSAGLLNAYITPTSYSHQSRFDLQTPYSSISYASPAIAYQTPLAYSHLY